MYEWPHVHTQCPAQPARRPRFTIKLHYYPETDSLYIDFKSSPGAETREVASGLNVDLDEKGEIVGFDIDFASQRRDLTRLETVALPVRTGSAE